LRKEHKNAEDLKSFLGKRRLKKGMFEGDLKNGMLEIGQVSGFLHKIESAEAIVKDMVREFIETKQSL
jgi:enoyl-[acyl-carrier protein] reductase II